MRSHSYTNFFLCLFLAGILATGCGRNCTPPSLNVERLDSIKQSLFTSGPKGFLVVPNPIDATRRPMATASESDVRNALDDFSLPGLLSSKRLENSFLKVRISSIQDAASKLAAPNADGEFQFDLSDVHYSEVMAYHSVYTIMRYVEALGFSVVKSRPLYVLVRYPGKTDSEVNAVYDHNYLNPKMPRTMRLTGNGAFAPGVDRDMYWHEFGHLFNESASNEVGMDFAGDAGAIFTEGAALHECLADYLAESVSDRAYIGRWLARNLKGYNAGDPLRSAVDTDSNVIRFRDVALNDGSGSNPERYRVAEWCSRVLWQIREKFVREFKGEGAVLSDRLVFSAVSLLKKDSSIEVFRSALLQADEQLHCGGHEGDIRDAFESRGFRAKFPELSKRMVFKAEATSLDVSGSQFKAVSGGRGFGFKIYIANPSTEVARNVRVKLEVDDPNITLVTYMQGYGDIPSGGQITIGEGNLGYEFSVAGEADEGVASGKTVRYKLILQVDNGAEEVAQGEIRL